MSSMTSDDVSEKTSIVSGDTFSGRLRQADETPPALVVLMGPGPYMGRQFSLIQPEYILGRSADCSIHIDDKSVSRSHARIQVAGQEVTIVDMGSANKTVVNVSTLQPGAPIKLANNDQIKVGNVILKFLERGSIEAVTNRELNEKATRDALTGAYSKGALLERGPEVVKRAQTLDESLSVMIFDIDFFKKINDQFGHAAGDYVLKELSKIVGTKLTRAEDFFARYGGEEFVVILVGTALKAAFEVSERIRQTVQQTSFQYEGRVIPVTVSIGVCSRLVHENSWDEILKRADEALYSSKQNGRNKVTIGAGQSL